MSTMIAAVLDSVKTWDRASQHELVEQIESLWDEEDEPTNEDIDELRHDPEFVAELQRRSRAIENGTMKTVEWSESQRRILASVGVTNDE